MRNVGEYHDLYVHSNKLLLADVFENFRNISITIESSYHQYWDLNNLYGWAMSQKVPVNNFEWIKDTFQFIAGFIKNYNEENDGEYFLKFMFDILKNYMNFIIIYHFYKKEWRLEKSKVMRLIYMTKLNMLSTNIKSWTNFEKSS